MDLDGNGEGERLSRVMVLEDLDRDGVMDKATPFLEDMDNARSLAFVDDSVLVVETGGLWLCRDNDGDLRCDERKNSSISLLRFRQHRACGECPAFRSR